LMEPAEFSELTHRTTANLVGRIPARYREAMEGLLIGGEMRLVVTNLAITLVDDQVPVTAAERDDVRRLLEHLKEPTDNLARLNVVPEA